MYHPLLEETECYSIRRLQNVLATEGFLSQLLAGLTADKSHCHGNECLFDEFGSRRHPAILCAMT